MDLQFHGANCISVTYKGARIVIDDNLAELGAKSVTKPDDVSLFTGQPGSTIGRLSFAGPGEYEVSDVSIIGIPVRSHLDEPNQVSGTMYKLVAGENSILITGHIFPELNDKLLEAIGLIDVMFVPVGGHGFTVDPIGALKLIKEIEPKLVIPTHYDDRALKFEVPQTELPIALKELAMEPKETVSKLKLKPGELSDVTQLVILEKS